MDKNITTSTFKESFLPLSHEFFMKQIENLKLDKYTKKLDTLKLTKLLVFAQLDQLESLADISLELRTNEQLQQEVELESISGSQLSRKLRDLTPEVYENSFHHLVTQIHRQMGCRKGNEALGRINLIDASTISLCLTQYRWADFRNTKAGIKLHTRVIYHGDEVTPDKVIIKPARASDKSEMNQLVVQEPDALNVFDRGYIEYKLFDQYCEGGTRFVTRLKANAIIEVIEEKSVDPNGPILREAMVLLGNPSTYQMKHPLRLIETRDNHGNAIVIVTDDMQMSTIELGDIYRYRWHIELFFKWIKQNLHVKRFYGTSANAVYTQIRIALITYCLLVLLKQKIVYGGSLLMVYKLLQRCWSESLETMIRKLHGNKTRTSGGRKKFNHEQIFIETMHQYDMGEIGHLNNLEYDPIN
jgi:hypothetical protein